MSRSSVTAASRTKKRYVVYGKTLNRFIRKNFSLTMDACACSLREEIRFTSSYMVISLLLLKNYTLCVSYMHVDSISRESALYCTCQLKRTISAATRTQIPNIAYRELHQVSEKNIYFLTMIQIGQTLLRYLYSSLYYLLSMLAKNINF